MAGTTSTIQKEVQRRATVGPRTLTPLSASDDQRTHLESLRRRLAKAGATIDAAPAYRLAGPAKEMTELPEPIPALLAQIVDALARGEAVAVVPVGKELTTQQAARVLNVSRQYVIQLLDGGRIPFRKTGTHRRIRAEDVLAYKAHRDRERMAALDDLVRLTEDIGGYEDEARESGD